MKTHHLNKKLVTIIALLLSSLFHTSFIFYGLLQKNNIKEQFFIQKKNKMLKNKIEKKSSWAETKARANNFGAPVLFQNSPPLSEPNKNNLPDPKHATDKLSTSFDTNTPGVINSVDQSNRKNEPSAIEKSEKITSDTLPLEKLSKRNGAHVRLRRKRPDIDYVKRKQEDSKRNPETLSEQTHVQTQQTTIKPTQSIMQSLKQLPTLAQLTQGFLYQQKNKGSHNISIVGSKNIMRTDEQIKCERYIEKLSWCIQNIFNIHNHRVEYSHRAKNKAQILLALNQNGSIRKLTLIESSGSRIFDQFLIFAFQEASSSFPPVPHYLPHDPFSIVYIMSK